MAEQLSRGLLADPAMQRAMLLPVARRTYTDPGDDITEELGGLEFAAPGLLYDPMLGMAQTGAMLMGDMPVDPNVMTQTMLDAPLIGGLLGAATGAAPKGAVLGANVFHGGPHRFAPEPDFPHGRPRLDKIGTGEGNQAYGYGFYSAEAPGVAEAYKTALAKGGEVVSDGQRFPVSPAGGRGEKDELLQRLQKEMRLFLTDNITNAGPKKLEADWQEYADETLDMQLSNMRASPETVEWANKNLRGKHTWIDDAASVYKLDIPDAEVAKYLDYDKPLSEQPKVIKALSESDPNFIKYAERIMERPVESMTGDVIYKMMTGYRAEISKNVEGAQQAASEALRKAGIPGLKYFDQDSRTRTARATIDGVSINKYKPQNGYEEYIISKFKSGVPFHEIKEIAAMRPEGDALLAKWELKVPEGTRNYVTWDQDVLDRSKMLERDGVTLGANKAPTAALPGLLDDTASRMQRARDMGFDVDNPVYHGTSAEFSKFKDTGINWFTTSKEDAEDYVPDRIFEGFLKTTKLADFDAPEVKNLLLKKGHDVNDLFQITEDGEAVKKILKNKGYDGIVVEREDLGATHYAVFDPKDIRSRFAKFDPAKADSADLLAANPATAALPGLLQDRSGNIDQRGLLRRPPRNQNSFPMRSLLGQRVYTATMPDGSI